MEDNYNESSTKKSEKNIYNFIRNIKNKENLNEYSENVKASFDLILYDDEEIMIKIKILQEDLNQSSSIYEKRFSESELKNLCKFYSILDSNQIFESIKNNFEEKKDSIYITKQTINITLNMSINILAEKIYLYIPLLQKTKDDEIKNLKESIYFLNKEKNNLK